MSSGGEAADQVVRLSMEGAEFALKIVGEGAERILALLAAALRPSPGKGQKQPRTKSRGRERLRTMLKSGAELKFFEIQGKDLKEFAAAAKKYGIAYCVLRQKGDENGMVEIMAKAEDASRVSRILEKLEANDLGGGSCEQTKSAKEVKTEQKATEKVAKQKQREGVSEARQQFNAQRDILREQYNRDIGKEPKPARERRQPRTRIGQLLRELTTEIARHIPVVGALVRRREEANAPAEEAAAPAEPEHETPAQDVADSLLAQPAVQEGQAQPEALAAAQPEQAAAHPTTRTERTTKEKAPSAPLLPTSSKGSATISDQSSPESVKAFLDAEIASRRAEQKPPAKSKQAKQQGKQPKQPPKKSKKKDKVK